MDICWERADLLAFRSSACVVLLFGVLIVCVPFLYGVWGRMWNSTVSVPDHCLFIYITKMHLITVHSHVHELQFLKWLCGNA